MEKGWLIMYVRKKKNQVLKNCEKLIWTEAERKCSKIKIVVGLEG